jgi:hypothetical protein
MLSESQRFNCSEESKAGKLLMKPESGRSFGAFGLNMIELEETLLKVNLADVQTSASPGVDVMITIFCDFRQFLAKKLAFFSKTNVMIKILHNLALF